MKAGEPCLKDSTRIFVYGTLKRGCRNHDLLARANFVGEVWTVPKYLMYDCGRFPALVETEFGRPIFGELYDVPLPVLEKLDLLEDVPNQYMRGSVELEGESFAQAYFYRRSTEDCPLCDGIWKDKPQD